MLSEHFYATLDQNTVRFDVRVLIQNDVSFDAPMLIQNAVRFENVNE